jgi:hypothetical protein
MDWRVSSERLGGFTRLLLSFLFVSLLNFTRDMQEVLRFIICLMAVSVSGLVVYIRYGFALRTSERDWSEQYKRAVNAEYDLILEKSSVSFWKSVSESRKLEIERLKSLLSSKALKTYEHDKLMRDLKMSVNSFTNRR